MRTVSWSARLAVTALATGLIACDHASPSRPISPPPSPVLPSPPAGAHELSTVFGTAFEHSATGIRPLPGLAVRISGHGRGFAPLTVEVVTDADGHYEVPDVDREYAGVSAAVQDRYVSPCSVRIWLWDDEPLDVHVVPRAEVMANGIPTSMPPFKYEHGYEYGLVLSGLVTEQGPDGARPVAGALVQHLYGNGQSGYPTGFTLTDGDGRYVLCEYDDDYGQAVRASKDGYGTVIKTLGSSFTVDIELTRY